MNRKMKLGLSCAVAALLGAPAVSRAQSEITVALQSDIRSLDPGVNRDGPTDGVVLNMVEGLVGYRSDGTVAPLLAKSVEVSPDGLTYTFKLRDEVKFHNGATLDAGIVVWNWKRYLTPATGWRCAADFDGANGGIKIKDVTAEDNSTVVFQLDSPSALLLDTMARTDCGMSGIIHPDSVRADGSFDKLIATGPFAYEGRVVGQSVTLKKFGEYASPNGKADGYTGEKLALVDQVKFLVVPDASTTISAVKAGNLDIALVAVSSIKDFEGSDAEIRTVATAAKFAYLFQTKDPLLGDVKMRRAIALSLDLPQLVTAASNELAEPNGSAVYEGSMYYTNPHKQSYQFDPARVKQLLGEANYRGQPITMITTRQNDAIFQLSVIAQAMMQSAGINAQLEVLDWATELDRYQKGNYQMMSFSYSPRSDPALSYEQFSGSKEHQPRKVWDNPAAQELIEQSMAVGDPAERRRIFERLHEMQIEDVPMVISYNRIDAYALSRKISGFEPWYASTPRLWNVSKK